MNEKKLEKVLAITLGDVYNIKNLILDLGEQEITFVVFAPLSDYDRKAIKEIVKDVFQKFGKKIDDIYVDETFMGKGYNFLEIKFYF